MTTEQNGLFAGRDGTHRCGWCAGSDEYVAYHDHEWGFAVDDDRRLFEKICLEGFQAGLSWLTILRKRRAFRRAFVDFDFTRVADFGACDVERLLGDAGIVRHRSKIESTINNARRALDLVEEFGSLAAYFWSFEPDAGARPGRLTWARLRTMTMSPESAAMSRDLKQRRWSFVGPTTLYAFMQAMGLVNDHLEGCAFRTRATAARAALDRSR